MKIDNDVLAVLSRAETQGKALTLAGQLDRRLYERTNKVLEAAGGKWNRKAKSHLFDIEAAVRIDQIILSGEVDIPKDEFDFFPTPAAVIARLLELADIGPGMTLLEPSAGTGRIAIAMQSAAEGVCISLYELMPANNEALHTLALPRSRVGAPCDFLAVEPSPSYDRVVMNPPFTKQADIKHVLHALKFLKPEGLLVSVMSAGVTYRDNRLTQDFRDLIRSRGGDIEALPEGSFRESGTLVSTVIATIPA